jgi:hypothetical protein
MNTTTCTNCGQYINEVVYIGGLPYGTTCAANKLGFNQFPKWFKGGDWDKAKVNHDFLQQKNEIDFQNRRKITMESWAEWSALSQAINKAYQTQNEWLYNFLTSIIQQLGYCNSLSPNMPSNFVDAENSNYKQYIPYLNSTPKKINQLSPKQINLIKKYINI